MRLARIVARRSALAVIGAWLAASPSPAQNLFTNPSFDTDINGWDSNGFTVFSWDAHDRDESPTSGSARVGSLHPQGGFVVGIQQCVAVVAGEPYTFGGSILIPTGQVTTGRGQFNFVWWAGTDCADFLTNRPFGQVTALGVWEDRFWPEQIAPDGARSGSLNANVIKFEPGSRFDVLFDELIVSLVPEPSASLLRLSALGVLAALAVGRRRRAL